MELALGTHTRSGGQFDIWEAVFSPAGPDGYPKPIWNKLTGEIALLPKVRDLKERLAVGRSLLDRSCMLRQRQPLDFRRVARHLIADKNILQPDEAVGAEGLYRPGVERIRTIEVDHFS